MTFHACIWHLKVLFNICRTLQDEVVTYEMSYLGVQNEHTKKKIVIVTTEKYVVVFILLNHFIILKYDRRTNSSVSREKYEDFMMLIFNQEGQ